MIHNIIELQATRAYEIMTPLVDLVAVELGRTDMEGFKQLARKSGYSRFPVYRDKIVNIIGTIDVFSGAARGVPRAADRGLCWNGRITCPKPSAWTTCSRNF